MMALAEQREIYPLFPCVGWTREVLLLKFRSTPTNSYAINADCLRMRKTKVVSSNPARSSTSSMGQEVNGYVCPKAR